MAAVTQVLLGGGITLTVTFGGRGAAYDAIVGIEAGAGPSAASGTGVRMDEATPSSKFDSEPPHREVGARESSPAGQNGGRAYQVTINDSAGIGDSLTVDGAA